MMMAAAALVVVVVIVVMVAVMVMAIMMHVPLYQWRQSKKRNAVTNVETNFLAAAAATTTTHSRTPQPPSVSHFSSSEGALSPAEIASESGDNACIKALELFETRCLHHIEGCLVLLLMSRLWMLWLKR